MKGFQETVKEKIYSFSGHLIIKKFSMNNSSEEQSMDYQIDLYKHPEKYPFIRHVQEFAHKLGVVKTDGEALGVLIKGVGKSFDTGSFKENMVKGRFIHFNDDDYEVVISRTIAAKLNRDVGDDIIVHFFQNPPRFRRLKITGIYETNLSEYFDSHIIISNIRMIQRLNDWPDSVAGGLEVFVADPDPDKVDDAGVAIGEMMDYDLNIERVRDRYIQVFEWLDLLSRQVNILLAIILTVVCVNMISIVLILVMERTQMIGMLKAIGGSNGFIRSIFIYNGVNLILKGLLMGNLLGLGLCFIQYKFKLIELNARDYYMSFVPISWHWDIVLLLNLITLGIVTIVLLLPTMAISRITPIKAIRFD